jgi:hypothetical protein
MYFLLLHFDIKVYEQLTVVIKGITLRQLIVGTEKYKEPALELSVDVSHCECCH